jgi:hypothetical protein
MTLDQGLFLGVQLNVGRDLRGCFIAQLALNRPHRSLAGALTPGLSNPIGHAL